jgi:hypothetical protein
MRPYFNSSYLIKVNYKKYLKINEQVGVVKRTKWMKIVRFTDIGGLMTITV